MKSGLLRSIVIPFLKLEVVALVVSIAVGVFYKQSEKSGVSMEYLVMAILGGLSCVFLLLWRGEVRHRILITKTWLKITNDNSQSSEKVALRLHQDLKKEMENSDILREQVRRQQATIERLKEEQNEDSV